MPEDQRAVLLTLHNHVFGPAGILEQEDGDNWAQSTVQAAGDSSGSNFLLCRTRLRSTEDQWIGSRKDRLRRVDDTFMIAERRINLERTVLLSRDLSNFF
jgi:ring hydroxylating enzyme beta subunit